MFRGSIQEGRDIKYYLTNGLKDCAGHAKDLLDPGGDHEDNNGFGWGYDGKDAELLAVSMLAISLDSDWPFREKEEDDDDNFWGYEEPYDHPDRDRILKHYRAFTEEIVVNLPDQWTMTSDEVLAWIKKKEGR